MFSIHLVMIDLFKILNVLIVSFIGLGLMILLYKININFVQIIYRPLVTETDKIKNASIIIFFILFYFFGILYLHSLSINMKLDLNLLSNQAMSVIEKYGWVIFILFIYLIGEFIFVITLTNKVLRDVFKYNIIKRHIYNFSKSEYELRIKNLKIFTIEHFQYKIFCYFDNIIKKSTYYVGLTKGYYETTNFIFYKGHYFFLCLFFIYEVITNKGIITNTFPLLIYIFIYNTILKISDFIEHLFLPYDEEIYIFIYEKPRRLMDKHTLILGENFHFLACGKLYILLNIYLRDGLYYNYNNRRYDNNLSIYFDIGYRFNLETLQYTKDLSKETNIKLMIFLFEQLDEEQSKGVLNEIFKINLF